MMYTSNIVGMTLKNTFINECQKGNKNIMGCVMGALNILQIRGLIFSGAWKNDW